MPNGKGFIDCYYCVYASPVDDSWPFLMGSRVKCLYHQQELPNPKEEGNHRFCLSIQANETWYADQNGMHIFSPFLRQVARFGVELEPGMLYEFQMHITESLKPLALLREPDYQNRSWKVKQEGEQDDGANDPQRGQFREGKIGSITNMPEPHAALGGPQLIFTF